MKGIFIVILGPSGSGKGTLIRHLHETHPEFIYAISATTRTPRPGEVNGGSFYFLSKEQFEDSIKNNEFIEWAEYSGNFYGTLVSQIIPPLEAGKVVVREMDIQGVRSLKGKIPDENIKTIFVDVGHWEVLRDRIVARAPIGEKELGLRLDRYHEEEKFKPEADYVIRNDRDVRDTLKEFDTIIDRILEEHVQ